MNDERAEIEAAIPHRDPFLFLDRVTDRGFESLSAEWTVPEDAEFFRGHYPGRPITPGVILSEHAFQCAALLISTMSSGSSQRDGVPVLTKIEHARFRRMVAPGETVATTVKVVERLGPAWYMSARVTLRGATVLDLRFVLSSTEAMAGIGLPPATEEP